MEVFKIEHNGKSYHVSRSVFEQYEKSDSKGREELVAGWLSLPRPIIGAALGIGTNPNEPAVAASAEEFTGGSSSYYMVAVNSPTTPGMEPYIAECNDIIEALGMNYAEGNAFKAIWRTCAARQGKRKKGYDNGLYDAEKVEFFGKRMIEQAKQKGKSE